MLKSLAWLTICLPFFAPHTQASEIDNTGTSLQIKIVTTSPDTAKPERIVAALISEGPAVEAPVERKKIVQSNAQFHPFITLAQPNSIIEFPNLDKFAHHVYSFSEAMPFELPLYSGGSAKEVRAENPGVIMLGCNIHDWMLGYIVIIDTPYATLLDKNHTAKFEQVPRGDYQLAIWHPSMEEAWLQAVSISNTTQNLTISLPVSLKSVSPRPTPDADEWEENY